MAEIKLREDNPYQAGRVIEFEDGTQILEREALQLEGTLADLYHTVTNYDRIDLIAYNYYKDKVPNAAKWYWVIVDANNIEHPLDLTEWVGKEIIIPEIFNVKLRL